MAARQNDVCCSLYGSVHSSIICSQFSSFAFMKSSLFFTLIYVVFGNVSRREWGMVNVSLATVVSCGSVAVSGFIVRLVSQTLCSVRTEP